MSELVNLMFMKCCLTTFLTLLFCQSLFSQWVEWSNYYPYEDRRSFAHYMHQTLDSNYLLLGSYHSQFVYGGVPFEDYGQGFHLVKVDQNGDTLWTRSYGQIDPAWIETVIDLADGNMLIGGTSHGPNLGFCGAGVALPASNVFLMKINQFGDTIWTKNHILGCDRTFINVIEKQNSELSMIVFMTGQPTANPIYDTWLESYDLDSNGNILGVSITQQSVNFLGGGVGCSDLSTGQYVAISSFDYQSSYGYSQIGHFDENGDLISMSTFLDSVVLYPRDIILTHDSALLVLSTYSRSRLVKFDTNGVVLFDREYETRFNELLQVNDSVFLAVGQHSVGLPDEQLSVTMLSAQGDSLWTRYYGDTLSDRGASIEPHPDGYIVLGTKDFLSPWVQSTMFIAPDTLPSISVGLEESARSQWSLKVFPNPANDQLQINVPSEFDLPSELKVFNSMGVVIDFIDLQKDQESIVIETGSWHAGVYFLVMTAENRIAHGKFTVVH